MIADKNVTYLVADIIGSSLIMQQDQRKAIAVYETFGALLTPIIEKAGGYAIEIIGDSISAGFCSTDAAVDTGFSIHDVLHKWNSKTTESGNKKPLLARIGIYSIPETVDGRKHQMALAAATCLQSLGSRYALCLSALSEGQKQYAHDACIYSRGMHDLGFLPDAAEVFYLYREQLPFLQKLSLWLSRHRTSSFVHGSTKLSNKFGFKYSSVIPVAGSLLFMTLITVFLFSRISFSDGGNKSIFLTDTENYATVEFDRSTDRIKQLILSEIISTTELNRISDTNSAVSDSSVVVLATSIQSSFNGVRLSWLLTTSDKASIIAGGSTTGRKQQLADLEQQFSSNIIAELKEIDF